MKCGKFGRKYSQWAMFYFVALALTACDQQPQVSVSSESLLDELTGSPQELVPVSRAVLLVSLSQGDLISIGESHALGLERTYLADLYSDLAPMIHPLPVECLVETGGTSDGPLALLDMNGPSDPVRAQFEKICAPGKEFDNPVNDYTVELAEYLPHGRVLTHTGARHMLPFGLIYPQDFLDPQWVDTPPNGTINRQVPSSFLSSNKTARAHAVFAYEDFLFPQLVREIVMEFQQLNTPSGITVRESAKLDELFTSSALKFAPGEVAHVFEIKRVEAGFPFEKAYLSLLNQAIFSQELLQKLIVAPEMTAFLSEVDPKTLQAGVFEPDAPNSSLEIGSAQITEAGTIYFYGKQIASEKTNPASPVTVYVTASPTQGPTLQHTN
jgi:hypothetical protein